MSNKLDKDYTILLKDILKNGQKKKDDLGGPSWYMSNHVKRMWKIKKIFSYSIWDLFFIDHYNGGSPFNAIADPPKYCGSTIKWKNLAWIFLIMWILFITYKALIN